MAEYKGRRKSEVGGQPVYIVDGDDYLEWRLPPRHDLRNHSPDGFQWGYAGSGPAQLALAILANLYDDDTALTHYRDFSKEVIANLPDDWTLDERSVRDWVKHRG